MKKFKATEIALLEKRYRAQLINSISGVKSANLIGTKDNNNQTNLAIVSSVIHLGSSPAMIGFVQRPTSVERHTYENIVATEKYTINAVYDQIYQQAHQTSARYAKDESEFDETSLEKLYLDSFHAPFVKGSPLQYALHLEDIIPIPSNGTNLIVGKVEALFFDEKLLNEDGSLSLDRGKITGITGLDTYVKINELAKLSYAKPDRLLKNLL